MKITFDNDAFSSAGTSFEVEMFCIPNRHDVLTLHTSMFPPIYFNGKICDKEEINGYEIDDGFIEIKVVAIRHMFDSNGEHQPEVGFDLKGQFAGF